MHRNSNHFIFLCMEFLKLLDILASWPVQYNQQKEKKEQYKLTLNYLYYKNHSVKFQCINYKYLDQPKVCFEIFIMISTGYIIPTVRSLK